MEIRELEIGSTEVLELLKYFRKEDVDKISPKFIELLKEYEREKYKREFDTSLSLREMDLNVSTKVLLGIIYRTFWANEEEKKDFDKILQENEILYREKIKETNEKYNIFEKPLEEKNVENDIEKELIPVNNEEKWYKKIFNKIISFIKGIGK